MSEAIDMQRNTIKRLNKQLKTIKKNLKKSSEAELIQEGGDDDAAEVPVQVRTEAELDAMIESNTKKI